MDERSVPEGPSPSPICAAFLLKLGRTPNKAVKGKKRPDTKKLKGMQEKTEGWVAGLILMMESSLAEKGNRAFCEVSDQQQIFDYLASEMFDRMKRRDKGFPDQDGLSDKSKPGDSRKTYRYQKIRTYPV